MGVTNGCSVAEVWFSLTHLISGVGRATVGHGVPRHPPPDRVLTLPGVTRNLPDTAVTASVEYDDFELE
ncbi:MAG: hypothetical protein ACI9OJ_004600 [Myxococcota bacterium]|jgi:hypothetical protein